MASWYNMSIQYFSLWVSLNILYTKNNLINLTFDIILFTQYTSGNTIFEYMKKWCCEQRSTLPGKYHINSIVLRKISTFLLPKNFPRRASTIFMNIFQKLPITEFGKVIVYDYPRKRDILLIQFFCRIQIWSPFVVVGPINVFFYHFS